MLMIVCYCACTVVYDILCLQKEAVRDDNTCMMIDNDKHASWYMMVHDDICIVISIGHPCELMLSVHNIYNYHLEYTFLYGIQ